MFANVAADSFTIMRKAIKEFECVETGKLLNAFYVELPENRLKDINDLCTIY